MLTLRRPTGDQIGAFLAAQAVGPFSYAAVGGTRAGACPPRFNVDHNRIQLGSGEAVFVRAVAALQRWAMFDLEWVTLCWPSASRLALPLSRGLQRRFARDSLQAMRRASTR